MDSAEKERRRLLGDESLFVGAEVVLQDVAKRSVKIRAAVGPYLYVREARGSKPVLFKLVISFTFTPFQN